MSKPKKCCFNEKIAKEIIRNPIRSTYIICLASASKDGDKKPI